MGNGIVYAGQGQPDDSPGVTKYIVSVLSSEPGEAKLTGDKCFFIQR